MDFILLSSKYADQRNNINIETKSTQMMFTKRPTIVKFALSSTSAAISTMYTPQWRPCSRDTLKVALP